MAAIKTIVSALCLILAASEVQGHDYNDDDSTSCEERYQNTLEQLMVLKQTCDAAEYRDCCQAVKAANVLGETVESGVHNISNVCPTGHQPFLNHPKCITALQARCDMDTDNGGWLVILRRKADAASLVNFNRTWPDYENGFGDLNTEFWYGLKNIHCLTQRDDVELMIELKQNDGTGETWTYQTFRVDGPQTNYTLHVRVAERIKGAGTDQMVYHNGMQFSTIDRDNDVSGYHCAFSEAFGNGGGWWYKSCSNCALTRPHTGRYKIEWGPTYFPNVEMKIRPKNCLALYN